MSLTGFFFVQVQESQKQNEQVNRSIEAQREEQFKKWGTDKLIKPNEISKKAKELLAKRIEKQTLEELINLAEQANRAANLIDFITDEYRSYYSDNYRYEFIQIKVAPFYNAYVSLSNSFKSYRDQCNFNIGLKHKEKGNGVVAFFYFRDAFRLSTFTEDEGDHKGMRYKAEIEMKKLLGLEDIGTFIYWK